MTKSQAKVSVLIINNHSLIRELWSQIISLPPTITLVGGTCHGREATELVQQLKPDVILMDIPDSDKQGIETAHSILSGNGHSRIVVLSKRTDRLFILEAIRAGIVGFLHEGSTTQQMFAAIMAASQSRFYFADPSCTEYPKEFQDSPGISSTSRTLLSKIELEILRLLAEGINNSEIAFALGISVKTVEIHRFKIMKKLNIGTLEELTRCAEQEGLCLQ